MRVTPWSLISSALTAVTGLTDSRLGVAMREPVTTTSVMAGVESVWSLAGAGGVCAIAVFVTQPVASVLADRIAMRTARRQDVGCYPSSCRNYSPRFF